jgi:membrane protein YqaA with SNARE-associated domain
LLLDDIAKWMQTFAVQYGYLGIFLISLLGAASVFIPIPSSVVIFILGGSSTFEPLWIAVAAGLGAAVGEFSGYLIGLGGRKVISDRHKRKMDILMRLFRKFGPAVVFFFALTPLPDDLLFIPLGVMRYGIIRAFVPALLGKFCSNLIIAYAGRFSLDIIRDIFGVEGEGISLLIGTALAIVFLIVVFIIMFKVDWERRAEKFLKETERQDDRTSPKAAAPERKLKPISNAKSNSHQKTGLQT